MSFSIFAAGNNDFYDKKDGCEDGSTFELIRFLKVIGMLPVKPMKCKYSKNNADRSMRRVLSHQSIVIAIKSGVMRCGRHPFTAVIEALP